MDANKIEDINRAIDRAIYGTIASKKRALHTPPPDEAPPKVLKSDLFDTVPCDLCRGLSVKQNLKHRRLIHDDVVRDICNMYTDNSANMEFKLYMEHLGSTLRDRVHRLKELTWHLCCHNYANLSHNKESVMSRILQIVPDGTKLMKDADIAVPVPPSFLPYTQECIRNHLVLKKTRTWELYCDLDTRSQQADAGNPACFYPSTKTKCVICSKPIEYVFSDFRPSCFRCSSPVVCGGCTQKGVPKGARCSNCGAQNN